jgi:hypothetical protein
VSSRKRSTRLSATYKRAIPIGQETAIPNLYCCRNEVSRCCAAITPIANSRICSFGMIADSCRLEEASFPYNDQPLPGTPKESRRWYFQLILRHIYSHDHSLTERRPNAGVKNASPRRSRRATFGSSRQPFSICIFPCEKTATWVYREARRGLRTKIHQRHATLREQSSLVCVLSSCRVKRISEQH